MTEGTGIKQGGLCVACSELSQCLPDSSPGRRVETEPSPSHIMRQVGAGSFAERQKQDEHDMDRLLHEASSGPRVRGAAEEES